MLFRIFTIIAALFALYVGIMGYFTYQSIAAHSAIFEAPDESVFGPADADLSVVKFMDYACVHCREVHPGLMQAVEEDGRVRLIIRPLPSASPDGSIAARLLYAASSLGKFREAHAYMMTNFGTINPAYFDALAVHLDIESATLNAAFDKKDMDKAVWENKDLFDALGGQVTPTFFIGPETIFIPYEKMPSAQDFKDMFNKAREPLS